MDNFLQHLAKQQLQQEKDLAEYKVKLHKAGFDETDLKALEEFYNEFKYAGHLFRTLKEELFVESTNKLSRIIHFLATQPKEVANLGIKYLAAEFKVLGEITIESFALTQEKTDDPKIN